MTRAFKMESENKWSQELGLINEQEYNKRAKMALVRSPEFLRFT